MLFLPLFTAISSILGESDRPSCFGISRSLSEYTTYYVPVEGLHLLWNQISVLSILFLYAW